MIIISKDLRLFLRYLGSKAIRNPRIYINAAYIYNIFKNNNGSGNIACVDQGFFFFSLDFFVNKVFSPASFKEYLEMCCCF